MPVFTYPIRASMPVSEQSALYDDGLSFVEATDDGDRRYITIRDIVGYCRKTGEPLEHSTGDYAVYHDGTFYFLAKHGRKWTVERTGVPAIMLARRLATLGEYWLSTTTVKEKGMYNVPFSDYRKRYNDDYPGNSNDTVQYVRVPRPTIDYGKAKLLVDIDRLSRVYHD